MVYCSNILAGKLIAFYTLKSVHKLNQKGTYG
jgi:hypothetical protein